MTDRLTIDVPTPAGGLMTQLHAIHRGIDAIRPTNDVDIVLHVESTRGVARETAMALESLGYVLTPPIDDRKATAHRFKRGRSTVDLIAGGADVVDVLVADHAAPGVRERLRGREMVAIEGGTQALRRTINARLEIVPGRSTTISVPSVFGALILNAAAHQTDSRDPERHLQDAAVSWLPWRTRSRNSTDLPARIELAPSRWPATWTSRPVSGSTCRPSRGVSDRLLFVFSGPHGLHDAAKWNSNRRPRAFVTLKILHRWACPSVERAL